MSIQILEYLIPIVKVIGAPIIVGVFLYYFTKFHNSDQELILRMILASLFSLFIMAIPVIIPIAVISKIIKTNDTLQQIAIFVAYMIAYAFIYIYISHVKIYYSLINKFYVYKFKSDSKHTLILKGYSELCKETIEVADESYFNKDVMNDEPKYGEVEKQYIRQDKLLHKKDDTTLKIRMLERKNLIRSWFKINGWLFSILNIVSPLGLIVYTILYDYIHNDILKLIFLGVIVLYTMWIQTYKITKFADANKQFKKEYLDDINSQSSSNN